MMMEGRTAEKGKGLAKKLDLVFVPTSFFRRLADCYEHSLNSKAVYDFTPYVLFGEVARLGAYYMLIKSIVN